MTHPLFASTELAHRIERAELDLIRAGAARVPGAYTRPWAGGLAVHTAEGSPLNKVVGTGFAAFEPETAEAELEELEAAYRDRGAPCVQVELATLAPTALAPLLTGRGYRLMGFENVLGCALPAALAAPEGIAFSLSPPADLDPWIDTVVTAFATPDTQGVPSHEDFPRDALESAIRDFATIDGLERYLAHRAGQIAGGASMRLHEGIAQLTGAGTLPAHRRKGVQTALLAARLGRAAAKGCDLATVTTQPGSKSMQNVQKLGFQLLYARAVLVREL